MGNSLRCCLACVLPCGALDLIRIVHLNGYVEELTGPITASQVLINNPNHVLTKPCSQDVGRRILILSPDSDLKRGSIYFLIPTSSLPTHVKNKKVFSQSKKTSPNNNKKKMVIRNDSCVDNYVKDQKKASSQRRKKVSVAVWKPNLHSISEDL